MNDELNNNQGNPGTASVCAKCNCTPCACPKDDGDENNNSGEKGTNNKVHQRTEPPKISWI